MNSVYDDDYNHNYIVRFHDIQGILYLANRIGNSIANDICSW